MRGSVLTQYTLYIRKCDHAMQLVEQDTGITIAIESVLVSTKGVEGIFIRPQQHERVGVYLMEDEIRIVEELPGLMISPIKEVKHERTSANCVAAPLPVGS